MRSTSNIRHDKRIRFNMKVQKRGGINMNSIVMNLASTMQPVHRVYVDCGNSTTSASCVMPNGEIVRIDIPTLVSIGNRKINNKAYLVKDFENENYVVGDENLTINTNIKLSKMDVSHRITLLTAIHQIVPNNALVDIIVGMPIDTYYNESHKSKYVGYLFPEKTLKINVNNIFKTVYFRNIRVLPESIGYVYRNNISYMMAYVDIGHTTIDVATYVDYAPIKETVFTIVDGANAFKTRVRDTLNKELLLNIQMYQMNDILKNGLYGSKHDEAEEIIYQCKIDYLKKIVNEMVKHNYEIETLPIVFGGGGSIPLEDVINEFETFSLSDEPLLDNLIGFEEVGELSYGEE